MSESRSYFAVRYRLDGAERYFVWYSDETDGVLLAQPDRLATFSDLSALDGYLFRSGLVRALSEPSLYDFKRLVDWLGDPSAATIDCTFFLDCWNMLSDVARSVGSAIPSCPGVMDVYERLFWGCNLPSVTPPGEHFTPEWSATEIEVISDVLSRGLQIFRRAAAYAA